jgi:filamentous hemagglutinin family protein
MYDRPFGLHALASGWMVGLLTIAPIASAQILPDATLSNPSLVNPEGQLQRITGGTQAGGNLFHSFEQFSVRTGETAFFDNAATINNIITRITGGQLSNIDGIIRANGSANLFLLNPGGIVFGPNAQLDIGGSFLGSTADRFLFEEGLVFSATNPLGADGRPPLLSINTPIGLQYGSSPVAPILVQQVALSVEPDRTLALLGGDIRLNGAALLAPGGQIALGSASGEGTIGLNGFDGLQFPDTLDRGNITFDRATVDVIADGGGHVVIRARNFEQIGSYVQAGIAEGLGTPGAIAGNIDIDTTDQIDLSQSAIVNRLQTNAIGTGGGISLTTGFLNVRDSSVVVADTVSTGVGGNITVNADRLSVTRGGLIWVDTSGAGNSGNISVQAREIELNRLDSNSPTGLVSLVGSTATGTGGRIEIDTDRLIVGGGAFINADTFGAGNGGEVLIRAADLVEVAGETANGSGFSKLIVAVRPSATGNGGNLTIDTGRLVVRNGAFIGLDVLSSGNGGSLTIRARDAVDVFGTSNAGTPSRLNVQANPRSTGRAGNISIDTARLSLRDGSQISAGTFGEGDGGTVSIRATDVVEAIGSVPVAPKEDGPGLVRGATGTTFPSGVFASSGSVGNAGDIAIATAQLNVLDGAQLSVNSANLGEAGNADIQADRILLDRGILSAETAAGNRANIALSASNLQLRRGSQITTNATGSATGGNIAIDTDTLVALANSDISANAVASFGGQVAIAAQGIFGTEFRDRLTPESDITATSELGAAFSGTVTLVTPDVDPSAGLVKLQSETTDPSDRIISGCAAADGSSFTVTGRGGLPEDPTAARRGQILSADDRDFSTSDTSEILPTPQNRSAEVPHAPAIEVTGWRVNPQGEIELVAEGANTLSVSLNCEDLR